MARIAIVDRTALDDALTLAPERYGALPAEPDGEPIERYAQLRGETVPPSQAGPFLVIDTTHASDGVVALRPLALSAEIRSQKRLVHAGDVIISRLRPYLRQIAYVDRELVTHAGGAVLCASTEFVVLRPRGCESIAFLVPFLLSADVQERLALAQEGGHHPRVPSPVFKALRVPAAQRDRRDVTSAEFLDALHALREAERRLVHLVHDIDTPP